MQRPPTERERLAIRLNIAAHEALRPLHADRVRLMNGVFLGSWRYWHDNTAGSPCYGTHPHHHVYYCTNHPQPNDGVILPSSTD